MTRDNATAILSLIDRATTFKNPNASDAERTALFPMALQGLSSGDFAVLEAAVAVETARRTG
jgi:hypothetical protein